MIQITIQTIETTWQKTYEAPVVVKDIVDSLQDELPYRIVLAYIDKEVVRLSAVIQESCTLQLLDLRNRTAFFAYQVGLKLMYLKAVSDVLGKQIKVTISNSFSKGLFTTLDTLLSQEEIKRIEQRMWQLQKENLPIEEEVVNRGQLLKKAKNSHDTSLTNLVRNTPDVGIFRIYRLQQQACIFMEPCVLSTGYVDTFELKPYQNGILLRFPISDDPAHLPSYHDDPLLYKAFLKQEEWAKISGVNYAYQLNALILTNRMKDFVLLTEALHEKEITEIARTIHEKKKRMVFISGPSSSGKTTFAKRLCNQLRVLGLQPLYLGTDDYFLEKEETPLLPDGTRDFESLEALDLKLFQKQMDDLLNGKPVYMPHFNFVTGKKEYASTPIVLKENQPIVMEGLHTLNPSLTRMVSQQEQFKIYMSPLTQVNVDANNRIPNTDARLLRRIARDARTRGISARESLSMWKKVRSGEDRYIFPYSKEADVFFDSRCLYELSALKPIVKPQLECILEEQEEYEEAQRLLKLMDCFVALEETDMIPNNSIIREFIGGSIFD